MSQTTVNSKPQALSVSQMLHLMRLEVDRALQHDYPITCLMLGLDGFTDEGEQGPVRQIMPELFRQLKGLTMANDVRGLGLTKESVIVAVFPHKDPQVVYDLAEVLVARVRALEVPIPGAEQGITISIGLGHNMHQDPTSFELLLQEAETGLNLAQTAGGDRCVQWKDVEDELDSLREELDTQIREIEAQQQAIEDGDVAFEERWSAELMDSVLEVFTAEEEQSPGVLRLKKGVIDLVAAELGRLQESSTVRQFAEQRTQIDKLERRIKKLTGHLSSTEEKLRKVAAMKSVDGGVASIYDSVQGLTDDDGNAEQKRGMLTTIFEANLALRAESA
ncbi:MAG: hypothetical protein ACI8QZ_003136 [Chlamydiales bacterium]|jgi:hypothetical protein